MATENRYSQSQRAFAQACRTMPGGVNSPVRAFGGVDVAPLFIASARGSKVVDIDGNEYIDYVGSWGPMILGHAHPAVIEAVHAAVDKGTSFGAPTLAETELALRIVGAFASIEKLRLISSGTEAVMTAIRLARAHTGRDVLVKMAGGYHGHSDSLLVQAGSGLAERGTASSPGVPEALADLTVVVPYNDIKAVRRAFDKHAGRIAAVLVEPVAANMGVVVPEPGYLEGLRSLCDEHGSVLIFDEVITGFRVAPGGAQQRYGINADLTCLGKIAGGGLPLAVCGGRADIMDLLAPSGHVYQAGTLSGNPIATAAANATLEILCEEIKNQESRIKPAESPRRGDDSPTFDISSLPFDFPGGVYAALESTAAALEAGLAQAAAKAGVPVTINRVGSIMSCFFTGKAVRCFDDVRAADIAAFKRFFAAMLERGIYLAPSAYEAMFVSLAHTADDIDRTIAAATESLKAVAGA
ncbi:MAG: glutamate-1-semialdehyde 2,1-aminomutase [Sedimentisphaerales bacterium]|nr:glutamate-1-semialdehyde 2,1-aminomutase [Sedimentisphaerales bacterium]